MTYRRANQIIGPLIFVENSHNVQYGEIVQITAPSGERRLGKVIEISSRVACIEVFEGTQGLNLENVEIEFTNSSFKIGVSLDMLGRVFDGLGKPIDTYQDSGVPKPSIIPDVELDINCPPINPYARDYPRDVIFTGISAIDGLNTLVRGQKICILTGHGLPHNKLITHVIRQVSVPTGEPFIVILVGIGVLQDEAIYFQRSFQEAGNVQNIISFLNYAEDPTIERTLIPRIALTTAEYFAFQRDMHVLVVMTDITNYAEAVRELSSAKGEIPSRKGFPGYLYSDFASIYERAGRIKGKHGSITQLLVVSMPNDDINHPVPDLTRQITEGQINLSRSLHKRMVYPPIDVRSSHSVLMKECIGATSTRDDHGDVASQIYSLYFDSLNARELESIIGTESLSKGDLKLIRFTEKFERKFLSQNYLENRTLGETLGLAWSLMRKFPRTDLIRISEDILHKYYHSTEDLYVQLSEDYPDSY